MSYTFSKIIKKARNHRIPPAIPNLFILVEMAVIETASENLSV